MGSDSNTGSEAGRSREKNLGASLSSKLIVRVVEKINQKVN